MSFVQHTNDEAIPIAELFSLEQIDEGTYRSQHGGLTGAPRKYKGVERPTSLGGHQYAQAAYAAAQTVSKDLILHSISGYWLIPGRSDVPFVFKVLRLSDGRNYSSRVVEVFQEDGDGPCFHCTCSFKTTDGASFDAQQRLNVHEKYKTVLHGQKPEDFAMSKDDWPKFANGPTAVTRMLGMKVTRVPMNAYNALRGPFERRALYFYTGVGSIPSFVANPNIHVCQMLYAGDRESASTPPIHFQVMGRLLGIASLSMTVVLHTGSDALAVCDENGRDRWFAQEAWTDRAGDGRTLETSKIYDEDGVHVATTMQDCLLKLREEQTDSNEYIFAAAVRERL